MRGAYGTAQAVADGIVERVVGELDRLELEAGPLPGGVVAEPALITAAPLPPEAVPIDDWPFVAVTPARTPRYVRTDIGADADTYLVAHDLRVVVWARSADWTSTALARDRATQAVLQVLLAGEGAFGGGDLVVDRATVSVDWSPVGHDDVLEAIVAAAAITFTVGSQELLVRAIAGARPVDDGVHPPAWNPDVGVTAVGDTQEIPGGAPPPGTV